MKEKKKLIVLLMLLVILVGINLRRLRHAPAPPAAQSSALENKTSSIPDPQLRLDLLQKAASEISVARNIFEYRVRAEPATSAPSPSGTSAAVAAPPSAPPAPLRYYGFAQDSLSGEKRVFLTDGEEIYIASEGEMIAHRYRVKHVAAASVELEDVAGGHRWSIPLEQP